MEMRKGENAGGVAPGSTGRIFGAGRQIRRRARQHLFGRLGGLLALLHHLVSQIAGHVMKLLEDSLARLASSLERLFDLMPCRFGLLPHLLLDGFVTGLRSILCRHLGRWGRNGQLPPSGRAGQSF